ncbi:MAG: alpha amylase C-terminal domain-containing protein, partial [Pseudomonadota bacterium]
HPGKKLLFMGGEFAQGAEWNHDNSLDWHLLEHPQHKGMQSLVRDLNKLYCDTPALHALDSKPEGFEWVEELNADESVFAWLRKAGADVPPVLVVANFTPVPREAHRVGVPEKGRWVERLNTDAARYGGGNRGNAGGLASQDIAAMDRPQSLLINVPPLTTLFFELERA